MKRENVENLNYSITAGLKQGEVVQKEQHRKRHKKTEAQQQAAILAADQIFRLGNCMVPIRLAALFTGTVQ